MANLTKTEQERYNKITENQNKNLLDIDMRNNDDILLTAEHHQNGPVGLGDYQLIFFDGPNTLATVEYPYLGHDYCEDFPGYVQYPYSYGPSQVDQNDLTLYECVGLLHNYWFIDKIGWAGHFVWSGYWLLFKIDPKCTWPDNYWIGQPNLLPRFSQEFEYRLGGDDIWLLQNHTYSECGNSGSDSFILGVIYYDFFLYDHLGNFMRDTIFACGIYAFYLGQVQNNCAEVELTSRNRKWTYIHYNPLAVYGNEFPWFDPDDDNTIFGPDGFMWFIVSGMISCGIGELGMTDFVMFHELRLRYRDDYSFYGIKRNLPNGNLTVKEAHLLHKIQFISSKMQIYHYNGYMHQRIYDTYNLCYSAPEAMLSFFHPGHITHTITFREFEYFEWWDLNENEEVFEYYEPGRLYQYHMYWWWPYYGIPWKLVETNIGHALDDFSLWHYRSARILY